MNTPASPVSPRSRRQMWILVAVFFAPLLLAFLLYYGIEGWRPAGRSNHGDLIDPPRPLPQVAVTTADGAALERDFMRGKWSLVYIGDAGCDARCEEALLLTRQTRLALNDDLPRVQRVFLATGDCCAGGRPDPEHQDLIVAPVRSEAGRTLLGQFPGVDEGGSGRIYVVDPLGNLMMSYGPDALPRGLLQDMKKLLKLSHIG
jgi:hypothetical protein